MFKIRKILPYASLFVSSTALIFQITILNPWHAKISKQIQNLEEKYSEKSI